MGGGGLHQNSFLFMKFFKKKVCFKNFYPTPPPNTLTNPFDAMYLFVLSILITHKVNFGGGGA